MRLPTAYAAQGTVVGFYNDQQQLVGGYMLITEPGFRSLLALPHHVKREDRFFKHNLPAEMMEVNGLWLHRRYTIGAPSVFFWRTLLQDMIACRKPYVLLMRDSRNVGVGKTHDQLHPTRIYAGLSQPAPGMKTHHEIVLAYTTRARLMWAYATVLSFYFKRLVKGSKRRRMAGQKAA